jgi:hypothetical protein
MVDLPIAGMRAGRKVAVDLVVGRFCVSRIASARYRLHA